MGRRLGQHFLASEPILELLAKSACGDSVPRVVEIGPGGGALTKHLVPRTDELHAIELDDRLAAFLKGQFASDARFFLHQGDVLEFDLSQWGPAVITGNLPYYITSPILTKFLELPGEFQRAVFVVQDEVADRILAKPGTRDFGYLTVATQLTCDTEALCKVPAGAFSPPPQVDSAGILLQRKTTAERPSPVLLTFVKRCFAQKRKTLRNNLRPFYARVIDTMPEASKRAEELSVSEFPRLFARLSDAREENS